MSTKTADNSAQKPKVPGKPFVKGDPRINKKGRPKTIGVLKDLALSISHEVVLSDNKQMVINGHLVTAVEAILRSWAKSPDFRKQQAFMEYAFGKVPNPVDVTTQGDKIEFVVKYEEEDGGDEDTNTPETPAP